MTWFFVDDHLHDHKKARRAGLEAMGLWTLAGSWCADNLTDGFVPADVAWRWTGGMEAADRLGKDLVAAGLWEEDEEDGERGWRFHDWADVQKTREQVLSQREKRAAAGREGGIKSGASRRQQATAVRQPEPDLEDEPEQDASEYSSDLFSYGEANAEPNASPLLEPPSRPVPSRPVPSRPQDVTSPSVGGPGGSASQQAAPPGEERTDKTPGTSKRGTRITADWLPPPRLVEEMRAELLDFDTKAEHRVFVDHFLGASGRNATKLDWEATWRNWMRRAAKEAKRRNPNAPGGQGRPNTADRIASVQALKRGPVTGPANTQLALGGTRSA